MELVTVKLTPSNSSYPVVTKTTTDLQTIFKDVMHDTYTVAITSDYYKPFTTTINLNGLTEIDVFLEALITQLQEWRPRTKVTTIPITTHYTDDPTIFVGVDVIVNSGIQGIETETWEEEFINNIATGQTRNYNITTINMIQRQVKRGTKLPDVALVDVLTQSNLNVTYSTNTYVGGSRTVGDAVPLGGGAFELRQWDNPSGALTIGDGDLNATSQYTLRVTMENKGTAVDTAKFVIGMTYFGGKHFINGVEVPITPSAGEYDFKAHFPNSGVVEYYYQFTTEPDSPIGDYFQINFDNEANDTIVQLSNLAIYQGHVSEFG